MFYSKEKEVALEGLKKALASYDNIYQDTVKKMTDLQEGREGALPWIKAAEQYVSGLKNAPWECFEGMGKLSKARTDFESRIYDLYSAQDAATVAVTMAAGTATVGVAIGTISGATVIAPTLSWLGGSAAALGGAGLLGGGALFVLGGPIGIAIGALSGFAAVQSGMQNKKVAEKAERSTQNIKKEIARIKKIGTMMVTWEEEIDESRTSLNFLLADLNYTPSDYKLFTEDQKSNLASLINIANSISEQLTRTLYSAAYDEMVKRTQYWQCQREQAIQLFHRIEDYVSSLANVPEECEKILRRGSEGCKNVESMFASVANAKSIRTLHDWTEKDMAHIEEVEEKTDTWGETLVALCKEGDNKFMALKKKLPRDCCAFTYQQRVDLENLINYAYCIPNGIYYTMPKELTR